MKSVQLLYLKTCSVANFDDIFNFEMENGIFEKQAKRMEKNAISCFFFQSLIHKFAVELATLG